MTEIEKTILRTISYFDIYDFPLTSFEVHKNLWQPQKDYTLNEISSTLMNLVNNKLLGTCEGFYFLKRKNDILKERRLKYLFSQKKLKKIKLILKVISWLPFIQAIFICNSLAYQNANDNSDIDLAIITQKNRIWTTRFFSVFFLKLTGKRPTNNSHKDKVCLSFFLTNNNLNLENIKYENDIHFYYWLSQFIPIYGNKDLITNFFNANCWLKQALPNTTINQVIEQYNLGKKNKPKYIIEKILAKRLGNLIEKLLKKFQLKIMPQNLINLAKENNSNVIISDQILKFHDHDTRQQVLHTWGNKVKSY